MTATETDFCQNSEAFALVCHQIPISALLNPATDEDIVPRSKILDSSRRRVLKESVSSMVVPSSDRAESSVISSVANSNHCPSAKSSDGSQSPTHSGQSGGRMLRCPEKGCWSSFRYPSELTRHMRTHTGERPYVCPHPGCTSAFSQVGNLNVHIQTHSRRLKKKVMKKRGRKASEFASARSVRPVQARPTPTKVHEFFCSEAGCGASFSRMGELDRHCRTHTGERPYPCPFPGCGKSFGQTGNLNVHIRHVHTTEKTFVLESN